MGVKTLICLPYQFAVETLLAPARFVPRYQQNRRTPPIKGEGHSPFTFCREVHRLDLEVATRDYRPHGLGEKAKAGFHLFARPQDHDRLRRVLDSQEITASIFAL
jgi:hypothetical protein